MAKGKKKSDLKQIALSGVRVLGTAGIAVLIGCLIWLLFFQPSEQNAVMHEGRNYLGEVQHITVVLDDGTNLSCVLLSAGSSRGIDCDWPEE